MHTDPRTTFNLDGMLDALKKALAERMLNTEMDHHLGGEAADGRANTRNGYGQKTVLTENGRVALDIPRDRQGTFDPQLIAKYQAVFPHLGQYKEHALALRAQPRQERPPSTGVGS